MRRRVAKVGLSLLTILISPNLLLGCQWAEGYFPQVTALKGKVVGRDLRYGPLGYIRWLRQRPVDAAQLKLYKYVWPLKDYKDLKEVTSVKSDANGRFDFGASIPEGHYLLGIEATGLSDWYDVEIAKKVNTTKGVLIDISPSYPDCKGGHEFIVYN